MSPRLAGLFERLFDDGRQLRGAAATGMETCIGRAQASTRDHALRNRWGRAGPRLRGRLPLDGTFQVNRSSRR
ncbi:MAG: hypothetical protein AUG47_08140 [Alphaproteobacteria bacterium 13_1_20CM_3_64_12]|jgi:hypothetical protein|nr:MAG: hypothetical protein AUG47_08140 [Alphaproteobacteria bacterium 13_1_20CM_3_64_12]